MRPSADGARRLALSNTALAGLLALAAAIGASFAYLDLPLAALISVGTMRAALDFAGRYFPPDLSPHFLAQCGKGIIETLAISIVGTLLAALAGALLALPAAPRHGSARRAAARLLLNVLRSVPELVWATLLVLAAGLGPFAGTLALAVHTTGVLGRLFAEAVENTPPTARDALLASGASPLAAFFYATLPQLWPQWLAYILYRWEMNIRMAAILGFVGAGGLGGMLYYSLSLFQEAKASTLIIAMLLLALLVDGASALLRTRRV